MDPTCRSTRDWLTLEVGSVGAPEREVRAHLESCSACADWHRAHQRQRHALSGLQRLRAPAELDNLLEVALSADGREHRALEALSRLRPLTAPANLDGSVVAALQAGSRQERSLRHLRGLDRLHAPAELDDAARATLNPGRRWLAGLPSPRVLERLVSEDLADLPRALTRRFTSKLPRLSAPAELEARVRHELARTNRSAGRSRFGLRSIAAAAAAALLLGVFGWSQFGASDRDQDGPGAELAAIPIEVRHLDAQAAFADPTIDPLTRRLADDLSNSRLSLAERAPTTAVVYGDAADDPGADPPADDPEDDDVPEGGGAPAPSAPQPGAGSGSNQPGNLTPPTHATSLRSAPVTRELIALMQSAPLAAVHIQRLVELRDPVNPALDLVYQEELWRDGLGHFAVVPGAVMLPVMSPAESTTFALLQSARQGYVERHRDFRVHDALLFRHNYQIIDLRQTTMVAGVPCVWLEVQARGDASITWRLGVDVNTGLIVSEERRDATGALLSRIEAVTVDYQPDLSTFVLDGGPSAWTPITNAALATTTVHVPLTLPDRYELFETATLQDALGRDWIRQLYSDGVAELFFLHEAVAASTGPAIASNNAGRVQQGSVLNAFHIAGALVLDGEVRGVRVIAVGTLREIDLLRTIDSALP